MIEKVNPKHPDKIADRIAGAIVDAAYKKDENPKIAVECLIGHGEANIIIESSVEIENEVIENIVARIAGENIKVRCKLVPQDPHLNKNQDGKIRCGDNGIFRGLPLTSNECLISQYAREIYSEYNSDGKYILDADNKRLIICQSNAKTEEIAKKWDAIINPLGEWTGGLDVDTGAVNRKLGSDMAHAVTGGGIHGKDLSKADVSLNIYAFQLAQSTGQQVDLCCAIGDEYINGVSYELIVEQAREFINELGGFEKLAEWGLF